MKNSAYSPALFLQRLDALPRQAQAVYKLLIRTADVRAFFVAETDHLLNHFPTGTSHLVVEHNLELLEKAAFIKVNTVGGVRLGMILSPKDSEMMRREQPPSAGRRKRTTAPAQRVGSQRASGRTRARES